LPSVTTHNPEARPFSGIRRQKFQAFSQAVFAIEPDLPTCI